MKEINFESLLSDIEIKEEILDYESGLEFNKSRDESQNINKNNKKSPKKSVDKNDYKSRLRKSNKDTIMKIHAIESDDNSEKDDNNIELFEVPESSDEFDYESDNSEFIDESDGSIDSVNEKPKDDVDVIEEKWKGPEFVICQFCDKKFKKSSTARRHWKEEHKKRPTEFICAEDLCLKSFKKLSQCYAHFRNKHKQEHVKKKSSVSILDLKCYKCNIQFKDVAEIKAHKNTVHKRIPAHLKELTECNTCGKAMLRGSLINHVKLHSNEAKTAIVKQVCEICGKSYNPCYLSSHRKMHSEVRPFSCEACGKSFKTRACLKKHFSLHTGTSRVICDKCGKTFACNFTLKKHTLYIHTDERPHACKYCNKAFKDRKHLTVHERIHTGDRPFQCQMCPEAFYGSGNLRNHVTKAHNKEMISAIRKVKLLQEVFTPTETDLV